MSADNYISIRKENDKYVGYHQFASADEPQYDDPMFIAGSVEDAIIKAQAEYTEYGFFFEGLKEASGMSKIDEKGLLIVDNLIWSDKEKKWDVVRSEYEPEEPVPGRSETTVFIDPEGGLHVSGAEISEAD